MGRAEYWACPSFSFATLLAVTLWRKSWAPGPATSNSRMCETSNRPAARRTARCSAMRPEYSTGMSQPPKGTILAPLSRWTAWSGVLRSSGIAAGRHANTGSARRSMNGRNDRRDRGGETNDPEVLIARIQHRRGGAPLDAYPCAFRLGSSDRPQVAAIVRHRRGDDRPAGALVAAYGEIDRPGRGQVARPSDFAGRSNAPFHRSRRLSHGDGRSHDGVGRDGGPHTACGIHCLHSYPAPIYGRRARRHPRAGRRRSGQRRAPRDRREEIPEFVRVQDVDALGPGAGHGPLDVVGHAYVQLVPRRRADGDARRYARVLVQDHES